MFRKRLVWIALLILGLAPAGTRAEERYYMLVFAAQDEANTIRVSHTFALFVKAADKGGPVETHSISWMPKTLELQPMRREPLPGVNLSLKESLKWAKSVGSRVTVWGPLRIKKELYDMAVAQEKRLNTTPLGHILLDPHFRPHTAFNCIHAVSDLDTRQPALETGTAHGNEASEMVVDHFQQYVIPSQDSMDWMVKELKLNRDDMKFATRATPVKK
jgi:hypothetical protein